MSIVYTENVALLWVRPKGNITKKGTVSGKLSVFRPESFNKKKRPTYQVGRFLENGCADTSSRLKELL